MRRFDGNKTMLEYIRGEFSYTVEYIARLYVKYIPEEYRVTAYDLCPELNPELVESNGNTDF